MKRSMGSDEQQRSKLEKVAKSYATGVVFGFSLLASFVCKDVFAKEPACTLLTGEYAFRSEDNLRVNELAVTSETGKKHISFTGTWRPTAGDGSEVHTGRIESTVKGRRCEVVIATAESDCEIHVRLLSPGKVEVKQINHCLGFGAAVDLTGRYDLKK